MKVLIRSLREKGNLILTCVARLVPQKDFPTLLQGLQLSLEKDKKIHLLVAGDGELKSELIEMSSSLGISNHITWLGNIDAPQELMRQSDIFVLSSRYEGFGLVLLEAMQAGIAIIAPNNSAIPEVLGANYEGLFETGNPQNLSNRIIEFKNITHAATAKKNLAERLPLFSLQEMERKTSEVYAELRKV
jgi:glycosyltransferase involved in cell wall biosynthesis